MDGAVALVLPLGLDSFAVAAALGASGLPPARRLRISVLMASFEAVMPLIGLAVGAPLGATIGADADYLAVAVLIGLGLYTLLSDDAEEETASKLALTTGWGAVVLGLSISLDELAIGFTFGVLRLSIALAVALIAGQALLFSQLGMRLGARLGARMRESAERMAGIALLALGIGLLVERLVTG
ncbi:MAG TPA: manganese efflux pump [Solirubrobacteraceae bacterium]|nr:manganese efflux pump [Solirubrobacteraceae bacterium]